ncbi:hypothetical protein KFE25_014074 [Diacronema lutheri]|uniref:SET domain-containing protein n=2 Tax=Diacronema lutheri TaxID=2081491 RepID=A0A8J5X846_DIALT|nr:hypothetical protein KFE25_014074 [Diacronema lutheri]
MGVRVLALLSLAVGSVAVRPACAARARAARAYVTLAAKKGGKGMPARSGGGFGAPPAGCTTATSAAELLGGYEALYAWLDAGGASRRVAIAGFAGLRGVMATEDVRKGDALIAIPSALALDLGVDAVDPLPAARAFLGAWHALRAARTGSAADPRALAFAPFFDAIPPMGSADLSTPDFFSDEELRELQWPPLEAEVAARASALRAAANAGGFDPAELNWARWVVLSRVLTVQDALPTAPARKLLIPLVDMCNHHLSRANAIPSGRVGGRLNVLAARDIARGEQVLIQYGGGALSNDRLLAEYGFIDGSPPALELDVLMLARALRSARSPGASADGSPLPPLPTAALSTTTLAQDERLLADAAACPPGSRLAAAVRFRAMLKRALAELVARQPGRGRQ